MKWYWIVNAVFWLIVFLGYNIGVIPASEESATRMLIWLVGSLIGVTISITGDEIKEHLMKKK